MAEAPKSQLRVGRLTKAHGLKGAIKLELYTDDPERRFTPGAEFSLQVPKESPWHGKRLVLRELRWYNGHPVGFFEGVDDRTAAETLIKAILWVEHADDEAAEPDAWYDHQLVGLAVVRDGERIGEVVHVDHLPAQDLLIVKTAGVEVMVPFVSAIVPEVDLEAGTLTVTPPAGLFEEIPETGQQDASADESADAGAELPGDEPAAGDEPRA
ncbi:ribosome maturation factor RimM [Agromyces sp. S2-1-8]|uniref:ribosome maturation factor RimM n=1 Tax=Agromyces sp. S2-1-8 TaxID=2897180 RepID=UPI001E613B0E|nr:ribosome maturation factor RimM [Agromyces sp. S2-1-8]MCD5346880.1 ribosome maturation factor RimM [Agromyces sp. S2-1-8]